MRVKDGPSGEHVYWVYANEENQLDILTDSQGRIAVQPLNGSWRKGLPMALFEDPDLQIPAALGGKTGLAIRTEQEWLTAIHKTRYSNGITGNIEELSPIGEKVPGPPGIDAVRLRYERRRRELVQADIHLFAADHWNFNGRFPNPGGNHGSFLRISTHSVWMMAGAGVQPRRIQEPMDSLQFAHVVLGLMQIPEH
jgi:hypothetical protein